MGDQAGWWDGGDEEEEDMVGVGGTRLCNQGQLEEKHNNPWPGQKQ